MRKKSQDSLIKNMFFGGATGIISKVGAFIFTAIVARNFLPREFGLYSLALTIVLSIILISDLGIGNTSIRYLAESIGKGKMKQTRSRFWFLLRMKILYSILFSLLLFFASGLIAYFFKKPELAILLRIGGIYLFVESLRNLTLNIFIAFQKTNYSTIVETIFQISRILLLFLSFYIFKSIAGIFLILSISLIISLIVSIKIIFSKYSFLFEGRNEPVERRRMLKFSGFLALSSITLIAFSNMDQLVLGYFVNLEFIGLYGAIINIISGVLGLLSVTGILFPVFTQLKGEKLGKAFKRSFHYVSVIAFPMAIGLSFVILPFIKLIYGPEYVPQEYVFSIRITSILLSLLLLEANVSSMYRMLFDAKEKPKIPALTNIVASIANIALNISFIIPLIKINNSYGLVGVASATFITRYSRMGILMMLSKKTLGIVPNQSSIVKPLLASLFMLGYLFIFDYFIVLNIYTGSIMILSAAVLYFTIILTTRTVSIKEIKALINK